MSEALDDATVVDEAVMDEAVVAAAPAEASPLLSEPRDGVPPVLDTLDDLERATAALAAGSGPVAVDAERASGYRYGQRAYLVQLRREGAGSFLIDPVPFGDLRRVGAAIADAEWVVHAASQDLPSLRELGLEPTDLFDTELAARLAGYERVGLATMVELLLGLAAQYFGLGQGIGIFELAIGPGPEGWMDTVEEGRLIRDEFERRCSRVVEK